MLTTGLGFDWSGAIGGWINQGVSILGNRYGVPPPGTVITTPGGQVIRQGSGYPVNPGGAYYPPSVVTPDGSSTTYRSSSSFPQFVIVGLGAALFVMVAGAAVRARK